MREHLFITTRHFENCHKFQIFGVGRASINQLGLVNIGDKVFFLNKEDNLIIGPYEVASEIFYNSEIIWQDKNGIDAYPYRVKLKSNVIYAVSGNIFSQIVEENGIRIDSGDLGQKSVFTFLPKDIGIIEILLVQRGEKIEKPIENKDFHKTDITIELAQYHGFTEAFLEFFILKDFVRYFRNTNLIPYNQFRISLLGSKIDIMATCEESILVIELKKDAIKEKDIEQFKTYITWTKNNKRLLGEFFNLGLDNAKIHSFIIGSGVQRKLLTADYNFSFKKYSIENSTILLSDI